jgi:EAL domain-containing protein (putative c-di-GMP-specific phosphodiesterase class I)
MHQAKRVPGISAQVAEERFERGSGASLAAEQALRHGLDGDEFHLVFQPKFGAADRRLLGFEALLRWRRGGALVAPGEFIPAAERTGLIGPLGQRVLSLACRQIAAWRDAGLAVVPVAVNVSRWQLADPGFAALVLGLLRAAGVPLSLDDFGEGLSSLSALRLLPLAEVKIDRGLVAPLPAADATAVIAAVCSLARALGVRVVGEGVENEAQAAALWACGCDGLQGYLLGRPEPAEQAGHRLPVLRGASAA